MSPWLTHEFDHRDPQDPLHDIDTGRYMSEMSMLPHSLIQMLEDGNMHAELRLVNDRYRVVKIVKKREPEFLQGTERHFIFNAEGKRVPLTEEEFNELLGMQGNPEDLFNTDEVDLETLDSEHVAPMDRWDVVFDATEYIQRCEQLINNDNWQMLPVQVKMQELEELKKLIYSADWFPYPADKRIHHPRAREIAAQIHGGMTKQQLGAAIGPQVIDKRPQIASELRKEAAKSRPGQHKARLLTRAQDLMEQVYRDRRQGKCMQEPISASDRAKLWALWREAQMKETGEVKLMSWQFEKALRKKLDGMIQREEMSYDQATAHLKERMDALYNIGRVTPVIRQKDDLELIPEWLQQEPEEMAPTDEPVFEEEERFVHDNWLPGSWAAEEDYVPDDDEYIQAILLSDGGIG